MANTHGQNRSPDHSHSMNIKAIITTASRHGLILRGGFAVDADDDVPEVGEGVVAKHLLLFGNAGSAMWKVFSYSDEYHDNQPDPLNRWSERIGRALANKFSARAFFPFEGPPYPPFLRWAKKAEALQNSRLGMLIHPRFGLWHAYRFALAFSESVALPVRTDAGDICGRCVTRPCRGACPVNAFTDAGYDVRACYGYLESHPDSGCMTEGCRARTACPEGADYRYQAPHMAFHMGAFVAAMAAGEFAEAIHGSAPRSP